MKKTVVYVTSNANKREEIDVLLSNAKFDDGRRVGSLFNMELRHNAISERLEIDLDVMVKHEVVSAYREVQVPCIVEHAGLVFDDFKDPPFPGGLTKPMWKALHQDFVGTFRLRSYGATAKAVVGYCDGMVVRTFSGVTHGQLVREGHSGSVPAGGFRRGRTGCPVCAGLRRVSDPASASPA